MENKDVWDIRVKQISTYTVSFTEEVTAEQAKQLFLDGEEADILDDETIDVTEVLSVS